MYPQRTILYASTADVNLCADSQQIWDRANTRQIFNANYTELNVNFLMQVERGCWSSDCRQIAATPETQRQAVFANPSSRQRAFACVSKQAARNSSLVVQASLETITDHTSTRLFLPQTGCVDVLVELRLLAPDNNRMGVARTQRRDMRVARKSFRMGHRQKISRRIKIAKLWAFNDSLTPAGIRPATYGCIAQPT